MGARAPFVDGDSRDAGAADEGTPSSFRFDANFMPTALNPVQALYASIINYNIANNVVKMSFTLQYRRIFGSSSPTADQVCRWFFFFLMVWAVVQAILLGLSCVPLAVIVPSMAGKCLDTVPVWYASQSLNVFTDFLIFSVPLPYVYKLTMPTKEKFLVLGIFSLGFFTWTISVIRLSYLGAVPVARDPTWDNVELTLWSVTELNCGILCACLQTLRPLLSKFKICSSHLGYDNRRCVRRPLSDGVFLETAPLTRRISHESDNEDRHDQEFG
ncbi:hypothetical protein CHGG_03462 [Chaetomium globosum CBS 148.51]|uniref:Rhodopsin domain-containing protein n=1 Tax=Chaetomium globosum (strain ATCC 6205 / CBS 148.51 / DSM 1962 / NBRC 6347 / NRRL 1970) TaxID=306901 RepID=Q2H8J2_CHAGB|nr:uncharacterized protein CHGG_03462 [Chaetomium globosum CBS 148.51]EAQ91527.1 hypothetical protein CHGG_03462 [Chaetomium globosum CBS 148.51]